MIFIEKLKLYDVLHLLRSKQKALYGTKSLAARFVERLLNRLGQSVDATKIDFGNINAATDIRRKAYKNAEACIEVLPGKKWADELSPKLKIDFWLIVQKFFFDELYVKFEFIEMALRFAEEHPHETHAITVDKEYLGSYADMLSNCFSVRYAKNTSRLGASTLLLLPLFIELFRIQKGEKGRLHYDNCIVCEVDGEKTFEMFSNLFRIEETNRIGFVIEKRNASAFSKERLHQLNIEVLGLRCAGLRYLRNVVWSYIGTSLAHFNEIASFGSRLFRIFYVLMQGRADVIEGSGNVYCTYEHLVTTKTVRNEFLKSLGNRTVFVPMNSHLTPQYYHSEIFVNYYVMCAAGPSTEILYRQKRALTDIFLPTGSYDSHRGPLWITNKSERIAQLESFKENSVAITILSPGICDPTYSHEIRLMKLAREIAAQQGVKVFIRLKPVAPIEKYANFYEKQTGGCDSILVTFDEYELLDFLEVTDLFITSISNSACDLALCGAQVMFIDYMKEPDLHLFRSVVKGIVLTENESFNTIMDWVKDKDIGSCRKRTRESVEALVNYIGYQYKDFDSYKANLLSQLKLIFKDHPALEGSK